MAGIVTRGAYQRLQAEAQGLRDQLKALLGDALARQWRRTPLSRPCHSSAASTVSWSTCTGWTRASITCLAVKGGPVFPIDPLK
jgi:hypothetical protein